MKTDISGMRRHYTLLLLFFVSALNLVDRQIMGVLIEPIKAEFGVSDTAMGLLTGLAFALVYSTLGIPFARYADRANRRNLIGWCCGFWSVMTMVCALAANYWQLALARMGVAVGESGSGPASLSTIADLYPPKQRARAMSIYSLGGPVGTLVGLGIGARIAYFHGWRAAILWMAAPGIVIALMVLITSISPRRGTWDNDATPLASGMAPPLLTVLGDVWRSRAVRQIVVAGALLGFTGYSLGIWSIPFLVRSQGLSLKDAGALMGLASGPGSIIGAVLSGWLCDRLGQRNARWQLGVPILGTLVAFPMALGYMLNPAGALLMVWTWSIPKLAVFIFCASAFGVFWMAPSYAALSRLVPADRRTTVLAIYNFSLTAIGGGLGPLAVGVLSDRLTPWAGGDALRWAMVIAASGYLLAALALVRALRPYARAINTEATQTQAVRTSPQREGANATPQRAP